MVEVIKIMETSFKRSHVSPATLSAPNPAAGHHQPMLLLEPPGHSQAILGLPPHSLVESLLLSPGSWCTRLCLCPLRVYFPVLCKFWQFYGGVNGDPSKSVCHTKAAAPELLSLGSALLTHTSTGDTQTQFSQSLWCPWVLVHTRLF